MVQVNDGASLTGVVVEMGSSGWILFRGKLESGIFGCGIKGVEVTPRAGLECLAYLTGWTVVLLSETQNSRKRGSFGQKACELNFRNIDSEVPLRHLGKKFQVNNLKYKADREKVYFGDGKLGAISIQVTTETMSVHDFGWE